MNRIKAQRAWTPEELSRLRVLLRQRATYAAIGAELGRSAKAISSAVWKFDLRTSRQPYRGDVIRTVRRLAASGYSDRIIGNTVGRTRSAISQLRAKLGIPAGRPRHDPRKIGRRRNAA